jgi:hypothetical protein
MSLTSPGDFERCVGHIVGEVRAERNGVAGQVFAAQSDEMRRRIVDAVDRRPDLMELTKPFLSSRSHKCADNDYNAGCHRLNLSNPFQEGVLGLS